MRTPLFLLPALLILTACPAQNPTPAPTPDTILRAYEVPQALASETQAVLSSLLYRGKDQPKLGSVVLSPTGQVLVSAPASFHEGVTQVVARIQKDGPRTPPPGVDMDYVLALGVPGEPGVPAGLPGPVSARLEEVAKAEGLTLQLVDRLRLSSLSGDRAEVGDARFELSQTATVHGEEVLASVNIRGRGTNVEAKVRLKPGAPMVLARAGYEPRPGEPFHDDKARVNATLFFVLTAAVDAR